MNGGWHSSESVGYELPVFSCRRALVHFFASDKPETNLTYRSLASYSKPCVRRLPCNILQNLGLLATLSYYQRVEAPQTIEKNEKWSNWNLSGSCARENFEAKTHQQNFDNWSRFSSCCFFRFYRNQPPVTNFHKSPIPNIFSFRARKRNDCTWLQLQKYTRFLVFSYLGRLYRTRFCPVLLEFTPVLVKLMGNFH